MCARSTKKSLRSVADARRTSIFPVSSGHRVLAHLLSPPAPPSFTMSHPIIYCILRRVWLAYTHPKVWLCAIWKQLKLLRLKLHQRRNDRASCIPSMDIQRNCTSQNFFETIQADKSGNRVRTRPAIPSSGYEVSIRLREDATGRSGLLRSSNASPLLGCPGRVTSGTLKITLHYASANFKLSTIYSSLDTSIYSILGKLGLDDPDTGSAAWQPGVCLFDACPLKRPIPKRQRTATSY